MSSIPLHSKRRFTEKLNGFWACSTSGNHQPSHQQNMDKAHVCIYVLDDKLNQTADEIKRFLRKECKIKCYNELEKKEYNMMSIGKAILKVKEKTKHLLENQRTAGTLYHQAMDLCGQAVPFEEPLSENAVKVISMPNFDEGVSAGTHDHEVVIVLGHSNVFNFGQFNICDILEVILHPGLVIAAFLGCCGGSARYGPLLMISQLTDLEAIFGFYQRKIYIDELTQTSLVTGIRNYLRLSEMLNEVELKIIAKRSFVQAALELQHNLDDPAIFANDSGDKSTTQMFLSTLKKKFSIPDIPLSCLHLALFHTYTFEEPSIFESSIDEFIKEISDLESSKIEDKCRYEIKKRNLDKLIEMVTTIQLLHVSPETLRHLKDGKWQDVDHLQFFVAILHGYWGKNSYKKIRACACYHLEEMKKEVDMCDGSSLQKYCLCAIGFCLFCEKTSVSFELPGGKNICVIGLVLYSELGFSQQQIQLEHVSDEGGLPWVNRFNSCDKDDRYIELSKNNTMNIEMSNYYEREIQNSHRRYNYNYEDFSKALHALKCYIFKIDDPSIDSYEVKMFENENSQSKGRMKCFVPFRNDKVLQYAEMRVTPDNNQIICRCRFVYQYHNRFVYQYRNRECAGILYFTDSHYGWDLIPEEKIVQKLKNEKKNSDDDLRELSFYQKLSKLSKWEIYNLQNAIQNEFPFPFVKIGVLKMKNSKDNYRLVQQSL